MEVYRKYLNFLIMTVKTVIFGMFFILISCKTSKDVNFIDDHDISIRDLDHSNLTFFPRNMTIFLSSPQNKYNNYHVSGSYTNIKPSSYDSKIPTNIFTKDNEYFNKVLHNKYIIYYTDDKKVRMRIAYFENKGKEKLETLADIYNYLKKEKIKYQLIKERKDIDGIPYADILLIKDSLYCKVKATKLESVSNVYYNAKDTLSSIKYGDEKYFYNNL